MECYADDDRIPLNSTCQLSGIVVVSLSMGRDLRIAEVMITLIPSPPWARGGEGRRSLWRVPNPRTFQAQQRERVIVFVLRLSVWQRPSQQDHYTSDNTVCIKYCSPPNMSTRCVSSIYWLSNMTAREAC